MKCNDFERNIYLYAELSDEEKSTLTQHLASCATCHELFEAVKQTGALVQGLADRKRVIRNTAQLTHKIMSGVTRQEKKNFLWPWRALPAKHDFIRYAFALASFFLALGFGFEFFGNTTQNRKDAPEAASIVLNSSRFREQLSRFREKRRTSALSSCASPLRPGGYLECLKNKMK